LRLERLCCRLRVECPAEWTNLLARVRSVAALSNPQVVPPQEQEFVAAPVWCLKARMFAAQKVLVALLRALANPQVCSAVARKGLLVMEPMLAESVVAQRSLPAMQARRVAAWRAAAWRAAAWRNYPQTQKAALPIADPARQMLAARVRRCLLVGSGFAVRMNLPEPARCCSGYSDLSLPRLHLLPRAMLRV
jgi:hypothetical protein